MTTVYFIGELTDMVYCIGTARGNPKSWKTESGTGNQKTESGLWTLESGILNPESKSMSSPKPCKLFSIAFA